MKKRLISIIILVFLTLLVRLPGTAYSQDSENGFSEAYREYNLTVEAYREAHDGYVLARSQYIKFGTLTAQNNAKEATLKMLEERDEVVKKYLIALRDRLRETEGVSESSLQGLTLGLDEEIAWFGDHKERLSTAGTLDDMISDSDDAKTRYGLISPLKYETLTAMSMGKVNDFRDRLSNIFSDTKGKINIIREEEREEYKFSSRKVQIIDRWIFETESKIGRSEEKVDEAVANSEKFGEKTKQDNRVYNRSLDLLGQSQLYLMEASSFVKEIIREIMTAE